MVPHFPHFGSASNKRACCACDYLQLCLVIRKTRQFQVQIIYFYSTNKEHNFMKTSLKLFKVSLKTTAFRYY